MRTLIIIILILQATAVLGQQLEKEKVKWYDFHWDGDSNIPKDAMILDSKIDSVDFNFRWQFDTGSPRTFVYGNVWDSFTNTFPFLKRRFFIIDTLKNDGFINLRNAGILVSGRKLPKNIIGYLPDYGSVFSKDVILENLGSSSMIGTIGIDLFREGVLIIDFRNNKIGYADRLSDEFYRKKYNTIDFSLYRNRIVLPLRIGKDIRHFFYDSGASLFPLKTSSSFSELHAKVRYTDTLRNITTWGKSYDVPGGVIKDRVFLGNLELPKPKIYVHPDPQLYHTNIFKEADTYGLIGNAYFDNRAIVIDFTKMKFTILP